jgi:hypothetical protein
VATINDIGVPGQPLGTPPLTEWQDAVRNAIQTQQDEAAFYPWSPSFTNMTVSTSDCVYRKSGDFVVALGSLTISAITGTPTLTLPFAPARISNGIVWFSPAGLHHTGMIRCGTGTTSATLWAVDASAAYGKLVQISATIPATWASGNLIQFEISYQSV